MFGYYGFYGLYYDATYLLVILGAVISMAASARVNSVMSRYKKVRNSTDMTGAEAARRILYNEGIGNVQIECLQASEGDHYDPRTRTVRLSYDVYNGTSVTAVAVAAHECGHAIQHAHAYAPLKIRSALVPAVNFASTLSWPLILLGIILSWNQVLIQIGIWAFALAVLFQLVTLPVEFDASGRALQKIGQYGLMSQADTQGGRKVLRAAAFTYVAAAAAAILQLLRLLLLFNRRDD